MFKKTRQPLVYILVGGLMDRLLSSNTIREISRYILRLSNSTPDSRV